MKGKLLTKALAATLCAAMAMPAFPAVCAADADADEIVYSSDFEDGDVSAWTKRGDSDTTVLSASDTYAVSGSYSLCAGERSKSWNGPAFRLDDKIEPGVAVLISAKVRGQWYTEATLSMQYDDAGGTTHYENLKSVNGGDWQELNDIKVSYADGQSNVYIYFEGGSDNIYVDDFVVKKAPVFHPEADIAGLKDVYADSFKIGTATTTKELAPNSTKELILKHFNSLTAGNELKPDAILDQDACLAMAAEGDDENPQVSLASARSILNFARDNNIPVRGHVLVWHQQTPTWFFKENYDPDGEWVSKEKMLVRMENYIKNVFTAVKEEYPDVDFYAWDVVNEAWQDDGTPRKPGSQEEGSQNSPWVKVFGDNSFIKPAFEFAKKYAPEGTKLYYNDFNEYMPQKTDAMIKMAEEINADGHYIDGLGLQSHLDVRQGSDAFPSASVYKKALDKFCATGLDVQVTELDATVEGANFEAQAQYYSDIMDAIYEHKNEISAVVFWGTTDDQSWRATKTPLLFNEDYTAKPCYYSIVDGIDIPEIVTTTTETTATTKATTTTTTTTTEEGASIGTLALGDVNISGDISVSDVVTVLQYAANSEKYGLDERQLANADVNADSVVDTKDAFIIQQVDAGVVLQADLPVKD
ncbi:MAG: endo-1,4-beta-xylanase [Ruminococcus sp.]|nr:endo-1,4-beta-xylanase [Ruminococcus sp.]